MSYAIGDMFYAETVNSLALLHITGVGKILGIVGGKPAWIDPPPPQVQSDWTQSNSLSVDYVKNKPSLASVAISGSYNDLINKPSIPPSQINSNWNSVSGLSQILNRPTLSTVAISGLYSDLIGKPTLSTVATTGSYTDLLNKPTIPSAQVNSDWNATSGISQILNKPTQTFNTPTFSSCTTSAQLSATRSAQVYYNFPTSMSSILGTLSVTATLQYADDSGFTSNVVNLNSDSTGCSGLLNLVLTGRLQVQGIIPAGKYRRVIFAQSGGVSIPSTLSSGQEILM